MTMHMIVSLRNMIEIDMVLLGLKNITANLSCIHTGKETLPLPSNLYEPISRPIM